MTVLLWFHVLSKQDKRQLNTTVLRWGSIFVCVTDVYNSKETHQTDWYNVSKQEKRRLNLCNSQNMKRDNWKVYQSVWCVSFYLYTSVWTHTNILPQCNTVVYNTIQYISIWVSFDIYIGLFWHTSATRQCTAHSWASLCEPYKSRVHRSLLWVSFWYIYTSLLTRIYHTSAEHGSVQRTRGHRSVSPIKLVCSSLFCGSLSIYIHIFL